MHDPSLCNTFGSGRRLPGAFFIFMGGGAFFLLKCPGWGPRALLMAQGGGARATLHFIWPGGVVPGPFYG